MPASQISGSRRRDNDLHVVVVGIRILTARVALERRRLVLGLELYAALAVELGRAVEAVRMGGMVVLAEVVVGRLLVAGVVGRGEVALGPGAAGRLPQVDLAARARRAQLAAVARLQVLLRRRLVIRVVSC